MNIKHPLNDLRTIAFSTKVEIQEGRKLLIQLEPFVDNIVST